MTVARRIGNSRVIMRRVSIAAATLVAVAIIVCAVLLLLSDSAIRRGVADTHRARAALATLGDHRPAGIAMVEAERDVSGARAEFHAADGYLRPLAPFLAHVAWIPKFGNEAAAAPGAARAGDQLAGGVFWLLRGLEPIVTRIRTHGSGLDNARLTAELAAHHGEFQRSWKLLTQARLTGRKLAGESNAGGLSSTLASFQRQLPRLLLLCRGLLVAPKLLGAAHRQMYLVVYQDPLELRATGGFIGSAGLLTVQHGRVHERFWGSGAHDNLSIPPPQPMYLYNREPGWLFRDSNWSPDFPTTAALERFFFKLDFHRNVANVVNVTPAAAAAVLKVTGPVYSPEYHRYVTAQNVAELADYYSHWSGYHGPYQIGNSDTNRKEFIGILAHRILDRLSHLSFHRWLRLGKVLTSAMHRGDILINLRGRSQQALIRSLGASGAVSRRTSDYLYIVDSNLSYDKINPYVHLSATYNVQIKHDRWLDAHLTIRIVNRPEPVYRMRQGMGPGAGALGGTDDYATFLRIYVPAGAELLGQRGWTQPWTPGPAYGKTMFCGYLIVRRGQTRAIQLHYIVPPNVFLPTHGRRYDLLVPHQPGSHPDEVRVAVRVGGRRLTRVIRHPDLAWTVSLPIPPLSIHPIPLPPAAPVRVAPGQWIEPHAYLSLPKTTR